MLICGEQLGAVQRVEIGCEEIRKSLSRGLADLLGLELKNLSKK